MIKTQYKKMTPPEANFLIEKLTRKYFSISKFSEKLSKNFLKRRLRRRILGASRLKCCPPPTPNRWGDRLTSNRRLMEGCVGWPRKFKMVDVLRPTDFSVTHDVFDCPIKYFCNNQAFRGAPRHLKIVSRRKVVDHQDR